MNEGGYAQAVTSVNDRTLVRKICQDPRVDLFAAYIVAMAWGGQKMVNFRYTLASQAQIVILIAQLRVSVNPRDVDFALVQTAAESIKGLNISFYTKLLYFFRPTPDAYILDKWTAMASSLLFVPQPVRLMGPDKKTGERAPERDTTPQEYEQFCVEIDTLPGFLWPGSPVTGDVAELAIFGVPPIPGDKREKWRKHVKSNFPPPQSRQPKSIGEKKAESNKQKFVEQLYQLHTSSSQKLPQPMEIIPKPALTTLAIPQGVKWVYDPAEMWVRVYKHYITASAKIAYQKDFSKMAILQNLAQANGWEFIEITGAKPGLGFKVHGNTTPRGGNHQIIAKCLQAMEILFATIP